MVKKSSQAKYIIHMLLVLESYKNYLILCRTLLHKPFEHLTQRSNKKKKGKISPKSDMNIKI